MKIEYEVYNSTNLKSKSTSKWDIRNESSLASGVIDMTMDEVALYTAEALITNVFEYSYEVSVFSRSYFVQLPALIELEKGYLAFKYKNKDMLRDFSKSSRIGEIAQGINYYFALNELGAGAVYNYESFCKQKCISVKGRKPDYVLDYLNGTYGLIESKGSMEPNVTEKIKSAYEQCESGKRLLSQNGVTVHNSFALAISFATSSGYMNRNSKIYVADPPGGDEKNEYDPIKAIMYEYSKFFYLASQKEIYDQLSLQDDSNKELKKPEVRSGDGYIIARIQLDGDSKNIEFGISEKRWDYLNNLYDKYIDGVMQDNVEQFKEERVVEGDEFCKMENGLFIRRY